MRSLMEIAEPTRRDREQAQQAMTALSQGHLEIEQLPDAARQILSRVLAEMAGGRALSVMPVEAELTTSRAASLLNVSRPYLSRLLDTGKIPFRLVGTHKRVRLSELKAYRERQDKESYAALAELQAQAQELNMGY